MYGKIGEVGCFRLEFQENPGRIPEEFQKNSRRIPEEYCALFC